MVESLTTVPATHRTTSKAAAGQKISALLQSVNDTPPASRLTRYVEMNRKNAPPEPVSQRGWPAIKSTLGES